MTARFNYSAALQHGQCSGAVRTYLKAKGFCWRVGHDLNTEPIRKFHCALAFLKRNREAGTDQCVARRKGLRKGRTLSTLQNQSALAFPFPQT